MRISISFQVASQITLPTQLHGDCEEQAMVLSHHTDLCVATCGIFTHHSSLRQAAVITLFFLPLSFKDQS